MVVVVSVVLALVLLVVPGPPARAFQEDDALRARLEALSGEVEALRELVTALTEQVARMRPSLHTFRLPARLIFAGQAVPLDRAEVAERLEREFLAALGSPAQVVLWLKRSARYFPHIEGELGEAGLPEDLKYVAVVESALLPHAYSWAHAAGIWQFIPDTGRRYGLRVTAAWDERRDPARSTAAALAYLRDLHRRFRDWPLALAAYNAGETRVESALRAQGVTEYYQATLPRETERYFFRVLAAKLILSDPDRYGFEVPPAERYAPTTADEVELRVARSLPVRDLARAAGSYDRQLRALNPALIGQVLPAGRYRLRLPAGQAPSFERRRQALERATARRAPSRVSYRVKAGDTLGEIAARHGVTVESLRKGNAAARRRYIRPGDVLTIERPGARSRR